MRIPGKTPQQQLHGEKTRGIVSIRPESRQWERKEQADRGSILNTTAKDLLVDCVGRGREKRADNFQGFGLMSRQQGHLRTWVGLEERQPSWVKQEFCL